MFETLRKYDYVGENSKMVMEKISYSTRGAIFEFGSGIRVFAFVKCAFTDIAFHKCEVSLPEKR